MNYLKSLIILLLIISIQKTYAQDAFAPPKESGSEEVVTKIIRIKGANGEEKVIKQQQVISKKSSLQLSEEEGENNMTATYSPEKVSVKNMGSTSNEKLYSSVPDGTGFVIILLDENGEKISKAKPLSTKGYYLINSGAQNNSVGHFDANKNLILEIFDTKTNSVVKVIYKKK